MKRLLLFVLSSSLLIPTIASAHLVYECQGETTIHGKKTVLILYNGPKLNRPSPSVVHADGGPNLAFSPDSTLFYARPDRHGNVDMKSFWGQPFQTINENKVTVADNLVTYTLTLSSGSAWNTYYVVFEKFLGDSQAVGAEQHPMPITARVMYSSFLPNRDPQSRHPHWATQPLENVRFVCSQFDEVADKPGTPSKQTAIP